MSLIQPLAIIPTYNERNNLEPACTQGLQIDTDLSRDAEVASVMRNKDNRR